MKTVLKRALGVILLAPIVVLIIGAAVSMHQTDPLFLPASAITIAILLSTIVGASLLD